MIPVIVAVAHRAEDAARLVGQSRAQTMGVRHVTNNDTQQVTVISPR